MSTSTTADPVRHTGTVQWFHPRKGYGFIMPDDKTLPTYNGHGNFFVHYTSIIDGAADNGYRILNKDERVSFVVRQGTLGPEAFDILLLRE